MASKITIKRSTTATPPAGLSFGEMAFVQGTGLTANQLYVGNSGGIPVWVGAQIGTTGSWTDNAAKTSLATQYAIDQRISSQVSASNVITAVDDNTNATRYLVFGSTAGVGITLGVDASTGPLSYNPSTGTLGLNGSMELGHATDTTIARVSAGKVSIEGVNIVTTSSTDTLTNKTYDTAGTGNVFRVAGVTLSAVTGTGAVVLATSPTLVTPALGTPSALVGTNITGTATSFTASNVTTNANLTGAITSVGNTASLGSFDSSALRGALTDETGSGSAVFGTAPTLGLPRYSISATVSAAGTSQGTATALTSDINVITTATEGSAQGVVLPTAVAGVRVLVRNAHSTVTLRVYPASGATIDTSAVDVQKTVAPGQTLEFVAINSTEWYSNVRATDSQVLRDNSFKVGNSTFDFAGTTLSSKRSYIFPDVDGTIALTSTKLSGFGSSTSAELASIISDETGSASSGKLVFNTSPTITTSLLTGSTGFALLNTTATTVNFAGAATALNMGVVGGTATFAGALTVSGDLTVNGTTTTINSTTLTVDDKNIEMAAIDTPDDSTANGGGIIIKGTTDKSILWDSTNSNLTSNQDWNLPTGKVFKINNASVLSSSALGSGITGSSLTQVGTITGGTWSGSFGAVSGANLTVLTAGGLTGTIPSGVLGNSNVFIGTTSVALNRTSASISLTGVNIDGSAGSATTAGTATTATTATNIVATEQTTGTIFLVGVAAAASSTGLLVNATPATALAYDVTTGELSATLIDGGSF